MGTKRSSMTRFTKGCWLLSCALVAATLVLVALFSFAGLQCSSAYRAYSAALMGALAWINAPLPFAIWDYLVVLLLVLAFVSLVVVLARRRSFLAWLARVCAVLASAAFLIVGGWALNHYAEPLSEDLQLELREYSAQELLDATDYYWGKAAEYALQVPRDESYALIRQDFEEQAIIAGSNYESLAQQYPVFSGPSVRVKRLSLLGDALLYWGADGIFMPLTGEACVPANCAKPTQAFNMCHEVAHRMGIAAEDEANFAAFLACTTSDDPNFAYSGYYRAFLACFNALAQNYPQSAQALTSQMSLERVVVIYDVLDENEHMQQYDGAISQVGQAANDAYLQAFGQEDGIQSYGAWVDYLIAWQLS